MRQATLSQQSTTYGPVNVSCILCDVLRSLTEGAEYVEEVEFRSQSRLDAATNEILKGSAHPQA